MTSDQLSFFSGVMFTLGCWVIGVGMEKAVRHYQTYRAGKADLAARDAEWEAKRER